jgi:ATP-binding cassette subfamily D (ALD) protein 2
VSRTLVSIYVAKLDGSIVKSIVDRKLKLFVWLMCKWMLIAVPATYINSMIQYLESKLSIAFRSRLVKHVYELYMKDETYYRIGNLDSRLSNPDQCQWSKPPTARSANPGPCPAVLVHPFTFGSFCFVCSCVLCM